MTLLVQMFSEKDIFLFPLWCLVFYFILRARANRNKNPQIRKLYFRAFYFKIICVLAFTLMSQFIFNGADSNLYWQSTKDMRAAIADDPSNFWVALTTTKLTPDNPLTSYYIYDNFEGDITVNYMISPSNYLPGKLALIPSYLTGNSYICINLFFGFFALGGAIRLFKAFYYFYPHLYRELAVACLFLPGVAFWSASLLKDPVTFGCIGYIMFAIVQMVFIKKKYFISLMWILICSYLLFNIKIYILLVLVLSLLVWVFAELNKLIKDKTLRYVFTIMTFGGSIILGYFLLNYLTSLEAARDYKLDSLLTNAESQRKGYDMISEQQGGSHFTINDSNPVMLIINSVIATFFRPFIWEINTPMALLSAMESAVFLFLTLYFMFKKGVKKFFGTAFSDGRITMCFVFAFVFAFAVGSSTTNFGALSRYKIPCTPYYLLMLLLLYDKTKLPLPRVFNKIVNFIIPFNKVNTSHVRNRRLA